MKTVAILICFLSIAPNLWSQSADSSSEKASETQPDWQMKNNSIYFELAGKGVLGSVSYERTIPIAPKSGIVLGGSFGFLTDIIFEVKYLYGEKKNFLEIGGGYSIPEQLIFPWIGYRYQGSKGFLFRAGGMYFQSTQPDSFGDFPWFGFSFGYSFQ